MSDACQYLHDTLLKRKRFVAGFDSMDIPKNGIYVLFEKGETGHGAERIVRVGTHRGQNNLVKRIYEHLYTPNKDRSIFRKHVGRCLLSQRHDPFLQQWDLKLTSKEERAENERLVNKEILKAVENEVTKYMNDNFSFVVFEASHKLERLHIEESLLSTVCQCSQCGPSKKWLGNYHPNGAVRESGLWNIQGINGTALDLEEVLRLLQ